MESKGPTSSPSTPSIRVKSTIATLWAAQFVQGASIFFILLALPVITEDLQSTIFVIIWVIFGHALVSQSLVVPMSRLGDLYGRKIMFVLGFSIASASLGLASIAADPVQLIAFRMLQGLGAGMTIGMIPALIVDIAPKTYRGRALGISNSGIALGGVVGPIMGGLLLTVTSWRTLFGVLAVAELGIVIAGIIILPNIKPFSEKVRRFDWKELLAFSGALATFLLGLTWAGDSAIPRERTILMFVIALVSISIFLSMETRKEHPMLDLKLFKIRLFGGSVPIATMVAMAVRSTPLVMILYLQGSLGLSPAETAVIIVFLPAVQVFNVISGWIADRIGSGIPMTIGISIYIIVFLTLSVRVSSASVPELMLYMSLIGLGSLLTNVPMMSMALGSLPRSSLGVGSGILSNVRHLGSMLGQGVTIAVFGLFIGQSVVAVQWIFLISMGYTIIAGAFLLMLKLRGGGKLEATAETGRTSPENPA
ncbi:MAG: MFS transporter [Thaumarchaeota archaeon]|nr:MFS transporter [Nitrososphaerota archaeon]